MWEESSTHTLEYLKNHTLDQLESELHINVINYLDRVVLNYDQVETPKYNPIADECRGLILSKPDYAVLCRPFDRFYNYSEDPRSKEFNIQEAICMEKIDGSLVNVYHDNRKWCTATRKMAFAEGYTALGNTYADIFTHTLLEEGTVDELFESLSCSRELTFSFELVSPETRVITRYLNADVYILNIRHRVYGTDAPLDLHSDIASCLRIKQPRRYHFDTFKDILDSMKGLSALEEGYVCYVPHLNWRIKLKNPSYLAVAHLRQNGVLSIKRIIYLVLAQDYEEYLGYFPEDRSYFQLYIDAYSRMIDSVYYLWERTRDIEKRKDFALAVLGPAQHLLFALRDGKTLASAIDGMSDSSKERLLQGFLIK